MSLSALGSRSLLFPIPEKQLLPNETLTSVLAEMEPWDAWPLRLVSKNFNSYILRVLAPRFYVPETYVYIRRAESWIFQTASPAAFTPPIPSDPTDLGAEGGAGSAAPPSSSHRGQKFQFSASQPPDDHGVSHCVDYVPSRNEELPIIRDKLYDEVEVIFRVGFRYYRHVQLPSLGVDRSTLVMSFDWLELYNIVLNMPEGELKRGHGIGPRYLWIPDRVGRLWMDGEDNMDFSDSEAVSSVADPASSSDPVAVSEGGSYFGVSHGDVSAATLPSEVEGVPQGGIGAGVSQGDTHRNVSGDGGSYESDFGAHSSPEEEVTGRYEAAVTPRAPRRSFESSPDQLFRSSPLTVEVESSSSEVHRFPHIPAPGESFLNFDDSLPENSSDSAERRRPAPGSVESSGVEVVRREIGIQTYPLQIVITAKFVQRWASWP